MVVLNPTLHNPNTIVHYTMCHVKELGEAHSSWEAFEEALWWAYREPARSRNRCDFDQWVALAKTHRGATKAFLEFGRCFSWLIEREQRLVGVDKVLLLIRLIN
mgnify:FL=1